MRSLVPLFPPAVHEAHSPCGYAFAALAGMLKFDSPVARAVIGSAIEVHRQLGPGLLETTYQHCLAHEMTARGIVFAAQRRLPLLYKGLAIDRGYRLDFVVEHALVVEIKAVSQLAPIHLAQVRTYLKLLDIPHGLLINFHVVRLVSGVRSILRDPLQPTRD